MKRFLVIVALALSALVSTGLGVGWATFRTAAGRKALTGYLTTALDNAIHGTVDIGSIGGSMLEGLIIEDLVIRDTAGVLLARLPRVVARYRLVDLVSRRVVLGQIIVTDPHINILKRERGGRFNYQEVLGLGIGGNGGPPPLVAFEDAEVHRATVEIRTPSDPPGPDDRHVVQETEFGLMRYRRVDGLTARLNYARIASPSIPGLRFDVQQLEGTFSDPGMDIRSLKGRIDIDGDSLNLDLADLGFANSSASLNGFLKWPTGKLELGLNVDARRWAVDDLRALTRRLPWGMRGTGQMRIFSPNPDSLSILVDPISLRGGDGTIGGRLEVTLSQGELVQFRNTELSFQNLSLEYLRPLLDTIPFAGRLTGSMTANGPANLLNTSVDWTFADSLVPEWPDTYMRGEGFISLGGSGTTFLNFLVDSARVDLGTLRRLFPSVDLLGHVGGAGNVTGFWRNAELNGRLWHAYDSLPVSRASGTLRFDSRTDTLGVYADLGFDSLYLASVRPSYPSLPPAGVVVGRVALNGPLDSLPFDADLTGPAGRARGRGGLTISTARLSIQDLDAEFADFDAAGFYPTLPATELFGRVRGEAALDSGLTGHSTFDITLGESFVANAPIDSGSVQVAIADSTLRTQSLFWAPGVLATAQGAFGLAPTRDGDMLLRAAVDSLGTVAPLLTSLVTGIRPENLLLNLEGSARIDVALRGSVWGFTTELDAVVPEAFSDAGMTEGLRAKASWSTGFDTPMIIDGEVDSLALGSFAFSDLALSLDGTRGRSDWFARARLGLDGSFVGWGKSFSDGRVLVLPLDSMAVLLPSNVWMLNHPAVVSVSDSGLLFSQFTLESVVDPRLPTAVACHDRRPAFTVEGLFPTNGSAELTAEFVAVPVEDLWGFGQGDPSLVDGDLCGTLQLSGTALLPVATSEMTLVNGRIGSVNIPRMTGQVDYRERRLAGAYEIREGTDLLTEIDFSLPVDLALRDLGDRRIPSQPLAVTARADSVDLRFLELFTETVTEVGGTMYADFGVRGSWDAPILTGTVSVVDGVARYPELGVRHRGVTGGAHLVADSILIDSLRAESGNGIVNASGSVRLDGLRHPLLDVRFTARDFHTANIAGLVDFSTSGTVNLRGPVLGASLAGSGTVTSGVLYFADLIEKEIINLEDTLYAELLDPELQALIQREGLGADFENRFLDSLRIDGLQLQMGRSMWLRSSQANVQLEGGLTVDKTGDSYRYDGTLSTPRGSYRLPFFGASKDFAVTDGEVVYFGTPDLNAALDINAEHLVRTLRGDNIKVFVNIGGTLNEPVVTLTSDREPPLPVSEIISYLLVGAPRLETAFGGTAGDTRPLGAMGPALNAVVGEVSSQVERALISDLGVPIDYLRVRWEGVSGAELSFGRRLGDQWFFIANPSVCWEELNQRVAAAAGRIEYRFAADWSWSFSRDTGTTCGALGSISQLVTKYQLGVDLLWQRRY